MRSYFPSMIFVAVAALVATPWQSAQALSAQDVGTIAEAITVRIEGQNPGSGVLIKRQGNTYTVLTSAHVVATEDEYELVTPDEARYPLNYSRVQKLAGVDLALVEFSSSKFYQVADVGDSGTVKSGAPVYVSGFPASTAAITERIRNFSPGNVTANARRPLADGYALVYTNKTLPGMSGGAVLDARGKLIGIHGRADEDQQAQVTETIRVKTGFNLAIPINTFVNLVVKVDPLLGFAGQTLASTPVELTADDWFLSAGEKYQKGDFRGAIADFDQSIHIQPNYLAYGSRGLARAERGDFSGAIADFDQAISIQPEYANAYVGRGVARSRLGDKQGAIADFDQVLRIQPEYALAYGSRGLARAERGDFSGAIADFDQAISIQPEYANAYVGRGVARSQLGDKQGAIADFDQALRIQPDNALAYGSRGFARSQLGDFRGAIADYDQALRIQPDDALVYNHWGSARAELGDFRGAIADFDQALRIQPDDALAYLNRGNARYGLGDKQGAIADLQTAARLLQQQGRPTDAQRVLEIIQRL